MMNLQKKYNNTLLLLFISFCVGGRSGITSFFGMEDFVTRR
jgi:hypothetical protein